ncbi:MAG: hypothetical protein ACR2JD_04865 [Nocardioides sp.]
MEGLLPRLVEGRHGDAVDGVGVEQRACALLTSGERPASTYLQTFWPGCTSNAPAGKITGSLTPLIVTLVGSMMAVNALLFVKQNVKW